MSDYWMCGPEDEEDNSPEMSDDGRTALSSDSGPIDPGYQWEETVDVSAEDDE